MPESERDGHILPRVGQGDSIGHQDRFELADPAAGSTGGYFTIPDVKNYLRYRIHAWTFAFTTDANAGDRTVGLRLFKHGGAPGNLVNIYYPDPQGPSLTRRYVFALGLSAPWASYNGYRYCPLPLLLLTSWFRVAQSIVNVQAGDQISESVIYFSEWLDTPPVEFL